ncbi:MAG: hypothetical protein K2X82_07095, partial [Gemmataceae bacterium]|nr:hypothetical protein [Gemmataceae bacterium]
ALAAAEPVRADLARATLAAAEAFARGNGSAAISTTAQALAEGVVRAMSAGSWKVGLGVALAAVLAAGGGLMWASDGPKPARGGAPEAAPKPEAKVTHDVPGYVTDVSFSPDGELYAVVAGGKVKVYDAATGKVRWTAAGEAARFVPVPGRRVPARLPQIDGQLGGWMGPDADLYVMGPGGVTVHNAHREAVGREDADFPRPKTDKGWHLVRFSPDGKRYAAHFGFGVRLYDTATGFEPVRLDNQHEPGGGASLAPAGKDVVFPPDGKKVVGVGVLIEPGRMGIAEWNAATGERVRALAEYAPGGGPMAAAYSPDGKTFAAAYTDHIALWGEPKVVPPDAADRIERGPRQAPKRVAVAGNPTAVAFSPDGKTLAVGIRKPIPDGRVEPKVVGHKTEVQLLDVATGKEVRRFDGFEGVNHHGPTKLPVSALAFSPDGKALLAGTGYANVTPIPDDAPRVGEVKVFALAPEAAPPKEPDPKAGPPAIVERNQDLWSWQERPRPSDELSVTSVAVAPDGKTFAAGGPAGKVSVYDAATRKPLWAFTDDHPDQRGAARAHPAGVAYSPDGRWLAVTRADGVSLLDAGTGRLVRTIEEKGANPTAVAFGPDGGREGEVGPPTYRRLASTDGRAVWATTWVDGGQPGTAQFGPLQGGGGPLPALPHAGVAYSPDGKRLVYIPNDKIDPTWPGNGADRMDPKKATHSFAQVWGGGSGEAMGFLPHGTDPVTAVAWSPDGRIATADSAGMVVIWDGTTYKVRKRVQVSGPVTALAFRSDGRRFAVGVRVPPTGDRDKGITQVEVFTEQEGSSPDNWLTSSTLGLQPDEVVKSVAFSPDGLLMVAGTATSDGKGGGLRVWDRVKLAPVEGPGQKPVPAAEPPPPAKPADPAGPWREVAAVPGVTARVDGVAFDPDGKVFVVAAGGSVSARDPATLRERWAVPVKATAVAFTPGFRHLLVARPGGATVLDPDTGRQVGEFAAPGVSATGETKPRELGTDPPPAAVAGGHYVNVQGTDFYRLALSDGWATWAEAVLDGGVPKQYVVTPSDATPKPAGRLPAGVAYDPTGERLVVISNTKLDPAWPENGEPKQDPAKATHWCAQVCRPDGGVVRYLKHGTSRVTAVGWSPDGRWVVTAGEDGNVSFWGADGPEFRPTPVRTVNAGGRGRTTAIRAVAFSPDSKTLAAAAEPADPKFPARVAVVEVATGRKVQELRDFAAPPASVAFSPDGKTLVVGCGRVGDNAGGEVKVFTTAPAR